MAGYGKKGINFTTTATTNQSKKGGKYHVTSCKQTSMQDKTSKKIGYLPVKNKGGK